MLDNRTQKLLQKKTLTPAEVPVVFAHFAKTLEGLNAALAHRCGAVRRMALHALHSTTPALEVVKIEEAPAPSILVTFDMPEEMFAMSTWLPPSWMHETCGVTFPEKTKAKRVRAKRTN